MHGINTSHSVRIFLYFYFIFLFVFIYFLSNGSSARAVLLPGCYCFQNLRLSGLAPSSVYLFQLRSINSRGFSSELTRPPVAFATLSEDGTTVAVIAGKVNSSVVASRQLSLTCLFRRSLFLAQSSCCSRLVEHCCCCSIAFFFAICNDVTRKRRSKVGLAFAYDVLGIREFYLQRKPKWYEQP